MLDLEILLSCLRSIVWPVLLIKVYLLLLWLVAVCWLKLKVRKHLNVTDKWISQTELKVWRLKLPIIICSLLFLPVMNNWSFIVISYSLVFFFAKTTISLALSIGCVYETMMQPEHNFLLLKNWKNITKLFLSWNTLRVNSSYFMQETFLKVEANNYSGRWGYHVVYDK